MTVERRVLKRFEPFVLGKCRCGCNEDIPIKKMGKNFLRKYINGHNSKGKQSGNYKGGVIKTKRGYIQIWNPDHPSNLYGYVFEHRLVMEKHIGRYLTKSEVIHHKNKIITDNSIENLMLFSNHSNHLLFEKGIDKNRFCLKCNSKTTYHHKNNYHMWYKYHEGYICAKCYSKIKKEILYLPNGIIK